MKTHQSCPQTVITLGKQTSKKELSNMLSAMIRNMQKLEQDIGMAPEPCFGGQRGQPEGNNCHLKEEPGVRKS